MTTNFSIKTFKSKLSYCTDYSNSSEFNSKIGFSWLSREENDRMVVDRPFKAHIHHYMKQRMFPVERNFVERT